MDTDCDAPPVPSSGLQDEPSTSAKKRFRDAAKSPQLRKKNIVSAGMKVPDTEVVEVFSLMNIISAFREEGVVVDAIVFNKLTPSEPKIVRRNEKITSGRSVVEGRTEEVAYVEKTYLGVQTITADYETLAKPSDNAAVFGSIQPNQWPKVARSLSSRMASKGVKASMKKMRANPNFEKAVALQIEEAPETVKKPEPVKLKTVKCTCELNGHFEEASSYVCDCSSSCLIRKGNVFGGRNNIFGVLSNLCKSAYYADVMDVSGSLMFNPIQCMRYIALLRSTFTMSTANTCNNHRNMVVNLK
ncbi:unnamed protein product [Clavelina lepadiformis]|uniref:Uncharacterized protein n=1 Tax=Clavelina lepadiformis TaxID=159417 RepID=A0ABP0GJ47_CLALP